MAAITYNTEPKPALRVSEPAMAYGSNAMMIHLQEEIMRQPLEIKESLLAFLQNAIDAVKPQKKAMTWREIAETLPPLPESIRSLRGSLDISRFTREEIEADPRLEHILRKHCGYEG